MILHSQCFRNNITSHTFPGTFPTMRLREASPTASCPPSHDPMTPTTYFVPGLLVGPGCKRRLDQPGIALLDGFT